MEAVALSVRERELADELCASLAEKHKIGRRATIEMRVTDDRVEEVFVHLRIARGHEEDVPAPPPEPPKPAEPTYS